MNSNLINITHMKNQFRPRATSQLPSQQNPSSSCLRTTISPTLSHHQSPENGHSNPIANSSLLQPQPTSQLSISTILVRLCLHLDISTISSNHIPNSRTFPTILSLHTFSHPHPHTHETHTDSAPDRSYIPNTPPRHPTHRPPGIRS